MQNVTYNPIAQSELIYEATIQKDTFKQQIKLHLKQFSMMARTIYKDSRKRCVFRELRKESLEAEWRTEEGREFQTVAAAEANERSPKEGKLRSRVSSLRLSARECLHYNANICRGGKVISIKSWIDNGIVCVGHLIQSNNFLNYNEF